MEIAGKDFLENNMDVIFVFNMTENWCVLVLHALLNVTRTNTFIKAGNTDIFNWKFFLHV